MRRRTATHKYRVLVLALALASILCGGITAFAKDYNVLEITPYGEHGGGGGSPGGGGGGNSNVVDTAKSYVSGLNCADCVRFVNSVYHTAGKQKPFAGFENGCAGVGNAGQTKVGGYYYCKGFSETTNPGPGDVVIWSGHVAIFMGNNKVSEGGGGNRTNIASNCNFNGSPWKGWSASHSYLHLN
jgi:hypothetical protein